MPSSQRPGPDLGFLITGELNKGMILVTALCDRHLSFRPERQPRPVFLPLTSLSYEFPGERRRTASVFI